ncbi:hypothetical protein [Paraliomyxa miuraensis]|uniref:hypothetical protein n=1 Tax=Paraliomyxa miuraensis TaxID=376150 RepID=UPI0022592D29|nr:hypothetical protein [Paraliomyxa miuraensis]MCX4241958.1 hypothetical protein [Paraliomyxa miuraensis]
MTSAWKSPRAWVPALVALSCALGLLVAWVDPVKRQAQAQDARAPRITDEGRALLGGLAEGERLMGWTVQALDGPRDGLLHIELGRDQVGFALMVATKGTRAESAPVETERYVIFYGHVHPPETILPDGTIRATTHALARRIRAQEATVVVPGM